MHAQIPVCGRSARYVGKTGCASGVVEEPRHTRKQHPREPGDLLRTCGRGWSGKANSGNAGVYAGEEPDWVREKLAPGNEMQLQDPAATADTSVIKPAKLYW